VRTAVAQMAVKAGVNANLAVVHDSMRQASAAGAEYVRRCERWYNNAVYLDNDGTLALSYDKTHLVDADCYYVEPGHAAPEVY
jgi:predicted amidohydrolase